MGKRRDELVRGDRRVKLREQLMSARWETPANALSLDHLASYTDALLVSRIQAWSAETATAADFDRSLQLLHDSDVFAQHRGLIALRQIVAAYPQAAQRVLDGDELRAIVKHADAPAHPHLAFEAVVCLGLLAEGDAVRSLALAQKGVVRVLLEAASSPFLSIAEQAVRSLAVVCRGSSEGRTALLRLRGLGALDAAWQRGHPPLRKALCLLFARLCQLRSPGEAVETLTVALSRLVEFIVAAEPAQAAELEECFAGVSQCVKASVSHLFEAEAFYRQLGAFYRLSAGGAPPAAQALTVCHRIFGGLTNLSDQFTDRIVAEGALECFAHLLAGDGPLTLKKEVCWVLCNVAMGTAEHVARLMGTPQLLDHLFALTAHGDVEMSKEALWVVCCLCKCNDRASLSSLIDRGLLRVFLDVLAGPHAAKSCLVLEALTALLIYFNGCGGKEQLVHVLVSTGIAEEIERLQLHKDIAVYFKARKILLEHIPLDD